MLKKVIIAAAIAMASIGGNVEAASFTTVTEYVSYDTFSALKGCQEIALKQAPGKNSRISKYIEINYLTRNHCRLTCVVEYE